MEPTFAQSVTSSSPYHPKRKLHTLFFLLLIATLVSAGATAYLLVSLSQKTQLSSSPIIETNPFDQNITTNPFANIASSETQTVANPFAQTTNDNPFDQFDTGNGSDAGSSGQYQNPF